MTELPRDPQGVSREPPVPCPGSVEDATARLQEKVISLDPHQHFQPALTPAVDELLDPCPFCSCKQISSLRTKLPGEEDDSDWWEHSVHCLDCGASISVTDIHRDNDVAIRRWNRRASNND